MSETPANAGRRPAPLPPSAFNVHIDHLVVDAGIVRNPDHLAPQVEAELARLLEDRGLPDPSVIEREHEAIRAGSFHAPRAGRAEDAAVHIARELYRALRP